MNGVTLKDPFDTAQEPQTEGKYDFEQSLNALLSQDYAPNKIVEIMGAAGFDSYDVASSLNQKYDDQRREMWNDRKSLQDQLNSEKEAYDNVLKKRYCISTRWGRVYLWFGLDFRRR